MNVTKNVIKHLKLDHGLQYKDVNFIYTKPLTDKGQLKMEEYIKVHIYEPTAKKQTSAWDIISKRFQTSECGKLELSSDYLLREHLKTELTAQCQQFLAETVLVASLDKQLQESLTDLYNIPADWFASINKRLVPGITSFHQEQETNDWLITINLPHWVKKYHMEYDLLVTRNGLTCSKEKTLEFLCEPIFNFSEATLLRMFHIKKPMNLFMNVNRIDSDEKQGFQINTFVLLDLTNSKIDAVAYDKIKVSNQSKNDIEKALESINPYSKLTNVFDKYGHYFCKNYILGNSLESMCYSYSELPTEIFINFQRFESKFEVNAFSDDHSVVKLERVEKLLNENNST
ncbi:18969_t:CDS:2, partial [Gigaspora margarita]